MTMADDRTIPATPAAKRRDEERREHHDFGTSFVDHNVREHVSDLQGSIMQHMVHVESRFNDGKERMDRHEEKVDAQGLKLDAVIVSVASLGKRMDAIGTGVQKMASRERSVTLACHIVTAAVLTMFALFKVFGVPPIIQRMSAPSTETTSER